MTRVTSGSEVPCDTLEALLTENEIANTRIVKIDVEGAEHEIVKGLDPNRFPNDAEFVIEVDPSRGGDVLSTFRDYNAFLLPNSYGFSHYLLDRPPRSLERLTQIEELSDVVFSRQETISL